MNEFNDTDIAIVGMSCYYPDAPGTEEFWANLLNKRDSITEVPEDRIDPAYFQEQKGSVDRFYCNRGGFVNGIYIDPAEFGILPIAAQSYDPEHLFMIKLAHEALKDAGVFEKNISLANGAFIVGKGAFTGLSMLRSIDVIHTGAQIAEVVRNALPDLPEDDIDKIKKEYQQQKGRYQADTVIGCIPNLIASLVANKLDMHGPAYTIDAACASSLIAIDHSIRYLQSGQCDIAVAGGIHLGQNAIFWSIFDMIRAMSHRQEIAPLSENADGLLIGEGCGVVVLKKLNKAIADKDRIYAVIKGIGVCSDGAGLNVMAPNVNGQKKAIDIAWESSGMDRGKLGYVEAHGTATIVGDRTEIQTLSESFPEGAGEILIGSVKSNIGHTMPAAGMAGVIKTALSLYHKRIPPTLHCEKPAKAVLQSRFRPVQEVTEWEKEKYPQVAAVNAFGFGGINAHLILVPYDDVSGQRKEIEAVFPEKLLTVSAYTKEQLISKLESKQYTVINDPAAKYRLVLFDPTNERIEKAKRLIIKDKPWRGRLDIWFSNEPLLTDDGKVVFMFPGYSEEEHSEILELGKQFGVEEFNVDTGVEYMDLSSRIYTETTIIDTILKKFGVKSTLNIGHSFGEWFALGAAGITPRNSVIDFLKSQSPEQYEDVKTYYVAVSCSRERAKELFGNIEQLYIANDNCPSQILMCGTQDAIDEMCEILKKEHIYYQALSYQSCYHTPFLAHKTYLVEESASKFDLKESDIKVWSCSTLEPYTTNIDDFVKTSVLQISSTVLFRELIEKLHSQEKARVFIQVGSGSILVGFVDDILKGKNYCAIPTISPNRSVMDQVRRILALIFIEGGEVENKYLNIVEGKSEKKPLPREVKLQMFLPIVKDMPLLREASVKMTPSDSLLVPADLRGEENKHPVLLALTENLRQAASLQIDMVRMFRDNGYLDKEYAPTVQAISETTYLQTSTEEHTSISEIKQISRKPKEGDTFEEDISISTDDYPFLFDHTVVKQPEGWSYPEDLNPVIPMTMSVELLAEAASRQAPDKKVVSITNMNIFKWLDVNVPFVNKIKGKWKAEDSITLSIDGFLTATVNLADEFPEPEASLYKESELGDIILPPVKGADAYVSDLFHGPRYQSLVEIKEIRERGIRARFRKTEGKGSLLDAFGQMIGYHCQKSLDTDKTTFPVSVQEIKFYQDMHDQQGEFDYMCEITRVTKEVVLGNVIYKRDNKVWCTVTGWTNRRFEFDQKLWDIVMHPCRSTIVEQIAPHVFHFDNRYQRGASWDFLYRRFLNKPEKDIYDSMLLNKRREYLISRMVVKDAVRIFLAGKKDDYIFPIGIGIDHDVNGKPIIKGVGTYEGKLPPMEISLAHKGTEAVCIVSDKPVGIDIESIEERSKDFMDISFTKSEIELIQGRGNAEWCTRLWVAKEAFGKMKGVGLHGNPKRYEVSDIKGDSLFIEDQEIRTILFKDNFVVGWTVV